MATDGQAAAPAAQATPEAKIAAMLNAENAPPPKEDAAPPADEIADPTGERAVEGDSPPAGEAPAPEDQQEEEKGAVAEIPLEQLEAIELEVKEWEKDGKERTQKKRTIKELREGYMRLDDYSRNVQDVAKQREKLGEESRQAIDGERNKYVQDLVVLQATLEATVAPELKDVNWNQLAASDAFEYVRLQNRSNQINQAKATIQARIKEVMDKQAADNQAATRERAQKARAALEQNIPGWNDALYQSLMKAGETYGYKAEEVGSWLDPRSLQVLHDAYQFRQSKEKLTPPPASKKVVVPPKVIRPGAASTQTVKSQQNQEAMKRLQGSGRINDAAAVIASRLR